MQTETEGRDKQLSASLFAERPGGKQDTALFTEGEALQGATLLAEERAGQKGTAHHFAEERDGQKGFPSD